MAVNQAYGGGGDFGIAGGGVIRNVDFGDIGERSEATLTVSNSAFISNQALGAAGGDGVSPSSDAEGGAIDTFGNTDILNSTFQHNQAIGGALAPGAPMNVSGYTASRGGALTSTGGTLTLRHSSFVGNQVIGSAGSAGGAGGAAVGGGIDVFSDWSGVTATISNCLLSGNAAIGGAGGLYGCNRSSPVDGR